MPYSTYSRIRDLLDSINNRQPIDIFDLSNVIHDEGVESFAIWRRGSSGASIKQYCSPSAIRWLIRFGHELGLISIDNSRNVTPTPDGRNALSGTNYNAQLATQINEYLEANGTSYATLVETIRNVQPPNVPDRYTVFESLSSKGMKLDGDRFRRIINLLVRTNQLASQMRRFFSEIRR
jgi:hypothetical protein